MFIIKNYVYFEGCENFIRFYTGIHYKIKNLWKGYEIFSVLDEVSFTPVADTL